MKNNVDSAFAAMKKLLTLFLALMCSTSLFADNYDCKIDGIYYKLDETNKTATVTVNGKPTHSGSIVIPNTITYHKQTYSVTEIGMSAFYGCSGLTSVTIPNSVTTIGCGAFVNCSGLTSVTIPNSVTTIGDVAFFGCSNLTSITIPNSVTTIGGGAFAGCSNLTSVTIPNSVTEIGYSAFGGCNGLTSINVDAANTHYCSIDGVLFNHTKDALIQYPIGNTRTKYAIPNSVTTIGEAAFRNCNSLTSVTIPNSVTTIGEEAFTFCDGLTSINVDTANTHYCSIDGVLFNYTKDTLIQYPIGNTRTEYAIPNSVTTIEDGAFWNCNSLTSVNVDAANTHYCSIDGVLFNYTKDTLIQYPIGNTRTEYAIPNSVTTIGGGAFTGCSNLTSVTIPNSVTTIGGGAFTGCSNLTSVTIPNSVTTIGFSAFESCSGLTSVTIPNSVTEIGSSTFSGCKGLTSVTIPNSVTAIGHSAFSSCSGLTSVTILNPEVEIGWAFEGCTITDLYCGKSVYLSQEEGSIKNVHRLNNEELVLSLPFDQYARGFVEPRINEWQKKGEFEKTSDWQARVTETYRKQQIDSLVRVAKKKYLTSYQKNNSLTFSLGTYDADNEVYLVKSSHGEDLLVAIPITDASYVKQNWTNHTSSPQYDIQGTEVVVTSVDFTFPNNKTYTYHSSQNLTYAQADIQYNFDPIDLNSGFNAGAPQPKGQQTIEQKKLTIGKSAVDTDIPITGKSCPNTFAVIISNENYTKLKEVPCAINDGEVFAQYCEKTIGLPKDNIRLYTNATYGMMIEAVRNMRNIANAYNGDINIIFYYSGHGAPIDDTKEAYLLPVDAFGVSPEVCYSLNRLYKELADMKAKSVTMFLDACFSGATKDGDMLASVRGVAIKAKANAPQGNMVVFSAASDEQTALPYLDMGHGMFTYYLLKKLKETKGDVTYQALGDYVKQEVYRRSSVKGKAQTPTISASATAEGWQSWKLR